MSDITVTFKNQTILTMDASGSKPLLTEGKYCEDDINIAYVKPSGGGVPVESGVFTVTTKARTYDINHSLGVVPNFAFIYPIDVHTDSDAYLIGSQVICGDFGQDNWTVGTNATARGANHSYGIGTGYSVSVHGSAGQNDDLPVTAADVMYAGLFTNEFVRVGGANQNNNGGWLLGTYGYFVGAMPIETTGE